MAEGDQAPMTPRVGLRMQLPESFTDLTYYGRGPKENYRDRRTSQFIGEYAIPVKKDMYEPDAAQTGEQPSHGYLLVRSYR